MKRLSNRSGQKDVFFLEKCKTLIEKEAGWIDSESLTNRDFSWLSEEIYEKSNTLISVSTLRRIWGKSFHKFSPRPSTLNSFAIYLGCRDWQDFKRKSVNELDFQDNQTKSKKCKKNAHPFKRYYRIGIVLLIATGIMIAITYIITEYKHKKIQFEVDISDKTPEIPTSIYFRYDVSHLWTDDIYLQVNGKKFKKINKNRHIVGLYLLEPGPKEVSLLVKNKTVKKQRFSLYTDGWKTAIHYREDNIFPPLFYVEDSSFLTGETLQLSNQMLEELGNHFEVKVFNFSKFNFDLNSDHFTFETKLKSVKIDNSKIHPITYSIGAGLRFTSGFLEVPVSLKQHIKSQNLYISELRIYASFFDMSSFITDVFEWNTLRFENRKKHVTIYLNEQVVYEGVYQRPLGDFCGIKIWFEGNGAIDYFRLYDENDMLLYNEEFDEYMNRAIR